MFHFLIFWVEKNLFSEQLTLAMIHQKRSLIMTISGNQDLLSPSLPKRWNTKFCAFQIDCLRLPSPIDMDGRKFGRLIPVNKYETIFVQGGKTKDPWLKNEVDQAGENHEWLLCSQEPIILLKFKSSLTYANDDMLSLKCTYSNCLLKFNNF